MRVRSAKGLPAGETVQNATEWVETVSGDCESLRGAGCALESTTADKVNDESERQSAPSFDVHSRRSLCRLFCRQDGGRPEQR
jgi:hypothetical protein